MEKLFQFSILSFFILYTNADDFDYCYAEDKNRYELFSTWTPTKDAWSHVELSSAGCKPIYVWSLMKHGIKRITEEQIKRSEEIYKIKMAIEQNNKEKRCALCWEDYHNLLSSRATFSFSEKENENLVKRTYSKLKLYATHLKSFIDSSQRSVKDNFEFQISKVEGAEGSAIQFSNQLLGTSFQNVQGNGIVENDALLRTKKNCAKWSADNKESDKFLRSNVIQFMISRVSSRLGFPDPMPLNDIMSMYESCVFWNNLPSINKPPFCAAFLPDDMKIMEYWQDLKHYYEFGYGNPLSEKMGCGLVRDMLDKLSKASTGNLGGKRGTFYVADEEHLMGMITNMGFYRDEESIKHDNYYLQREKRKWRSSLLDPFSASTHAVLYNCANNEKKVEFYINHDAIKFEACKSNTGIVDDKCSLDTFLIEMTKSLKEQKCDENFCGEFSKPSDSGSNITCYSFTVMIVCLLISWF